MTPLRIAFTGVYRESALVCRQARNTSIPLAGALQSQTPPHMSATVSYVMGEEEEKEVSERCVESQVASSATIVWLFLLLMLCCCSVRR